MMQDQSCTQPFSVLGRLYACEEIRSLRARYFRFVDAKRWSDLAALFAEDAVFDRGWAHGVSHPVTGLWQGAGEPGADLVVGREAIIAMIRKAVEPLWTIHRGGDGDITVETADTAHAVWAMSDEVRSAEGALILRGWGHYDEGYRHVDGRWLIARTRLTRQHLELGGQP